MITCSEKVQNLTNYIEGYVATNSGVRLNVLFQDWTGTYSRGEIQAALFRLQDAGLIEFKSGRFYHTEKQAA